MKRNRQGFSALGARHCAWLLLLFLSFIHVSLFAQSESYNWKSVAIGGGGFVSGIITSKTQSALTLALDGNKFFRVGNSTYYLTNQGTSWTQCSINGTKGPVAVSSDGNTFLHCPEGSTTTYRSTNNGSSWSTVSGLSVGDARPLAGPVNASKLPIDQGPLHWWCDPFHQDTSGGTVPHAVLLLHRYPFNNLTAENDFSHA